MPLSISSSAGGTIVGRKIIERKEFDYPCEYCEAEQEEGHKCQICEDKITEQQCQDSKGQCEFCQFGVDL